jgi:ABC-type protease/lipase transport system fused ATPase/permease subunit
MFIVAHRPSLLAVCDRVFQVEDGRVRVLDTASVTPTDAWQGVAR